MWNRGIVVAAVALVLLLPLKSSAWWVFGPKDTQKEDKVIEAAPVTKEFSIPPLRMTPGLLDTTRVVEGRCAETYGGLADALAVILGGDITPSMEFSTIRISGETGRAGKNFYCFYDSSSEGDTILNATSTFPTNRPMYLCRYGLTIEDSRNMNCVIPSDVIEKVDAAKAQLTSVGWSDELALTDKIDANQEGDAYYEGWSYIFPYVDDVPYLQFFRFGSSGDILLLRALVGYEKMVQFMTSPAHYMLCIPDNIDSFADRCR